MGYNSKSRRNPDSENYNQARKKKSAFRNKAEYKNISKRDIEELMYEEPELEIENG